MESVELEGLDRVLASLDKLAADFPDLKGEALDKLGRELKAAVDASIASGGFQGGGAVLSAWQKYYVGTRRGYVAVRPIGSADGAAVGPNGPGAVTNYNEGGHAIRRPAAGKPGYRPRIHVARVDGRHFYYRVDGEAKQKGDAALRELVEELKKRLENL